MTGKKWKAKVFKFFTWPIVFALSWILPGYLILLAARWFPAATIIVAVLYYGASVFMLVQHYFRVLLFVLRERTTPRRLLMMRLEAVEAAFNQRREMTIHVPTLRRAVDPAVDMGVVRDPQILSILDNVTVRHPVTWPRKPRVV